MRTAFVLILTVFIYTSAYAASPIGSWKETGARPDDQTYFVVAPNEYAVVRVCGFADGTRMVVRVSVPLRIEGDRMWMGSKGTHAYQNGNYCPLAVMASPKTGDQFSVSEDGRSIFFVPVGNRAFPTFARVPAGSVPQH